jgi:hypothetical protein
VGEDARERWLWASASEAGILHLSAHGKYDARNPLFSHIALAGDDEEDGRLEVYEIYNRGLNLENAELVVLSACQTNVGELSRGDEIVGLSRALIYAGAPSVVSSLWSVSDESTRVLMEKFYMHLREGMSKASALRQAQMEMIASDEYAHPYYWAAFGLTGDGGQVTDIAQPLPHSPVPGDAKASRVQISWPSTLAVTLAFLAVGGGVARWWWVKRRRTLTRAALSAHLRTLLERREQVGAMPESLARTRALAQISRELREIGRQYHQDGR